MQARGWVDVAQKSSSLCESVWRVEEFKMTLAGTVPDRMSLDLSTSSGFSLPPTL